MRCSARADLSDFCAVQLRNHPGMRLLIAGHSNLGAFRNQAIQKVNGRAWRFHRLTIFRAHPD